MASFKELIATKAGKAALQTGVAHELTRSQVVPVFAGYIAAGFKRDHAEELLTAIRAMVAVDRKAKGITKPLPPVQGSRVSEMRSVLTLSDWACRAPLFDMLAKIDAATDTVVTVSKWIRKNVDKKSGACPSRAKVLAVVNARKKGRTSQRDGKKSAARIVNPVVAIDAIMNHAKALTAGWGKADGAAFVSAIVKAATSYKPIAVKLKAAADKAKADAKKAKASK